MRAQDAQQKAAAEQLLKKQAKMEADERELVG
jgi:hypothetical protein